ncbi:DUF5024 domain-containing protein [Xylanibacter muris]|uniref:DUF5024 domain-containing protein n=1 Tax=Xylanibacter muris TaxID=2736290 RepID=A0ABX2ALD7_9BACT|nr:DUF5024 domain-containing protein [Xylanibacter muris]NPD92011.1 DUF5024 domain-containing protein [Xylanibacter muris]
MNNRIVIILVLTFCCVLHTYGQNKLDEMVEQYSITGPSTFTSAVERDPKTRKVIKVVKKLSISDRDIPKFRNAFKTVTTGNLTETVSEDKTVMLLTEENKRNNRIYMLTFRTYHRSTFLHDGNITVIIKYN